jgi:hypothetical protein
VTSAGSDVSSGHAHAIIIPSAASATKRTHHKQRYAQQLIVSTAANSQSQQY